MFYVFREAASASARILAEALGGRRIRNIGRVNLGNHDILISWGSYAEGTGAGRFLNNVPLQNKLADAEKLAEAGVPTVEVSRTRPMTQNQDPAEVEDAYTVLQDECSTFAATDDPSENDLTALERYLQAVRTALTGARAEADPNWIPRARNHTGGNDLLEPPGNPDYYVRKLELTDEFRVHSFMGRSIRAGHKRPRDGFTVGNAADIHNRVAHPWIRSWDAGWRILYPDGAVRQAHRDLAHRAVAALGLDFGAVDIGSKPDGSLVVLEVNRAPGIEEGTVDNYARAIRRWESGEWGQVRGN